MAIDQSENINCSFWTTRRSECLLKHLVHFLLFLFCSSISVRVRIYLQIKCPQVKLLAELLVIAHPISETNDSTSNRTVQEKQVTNNRTAITSRRSASPADESKGGTKKVRPTGNADVREWDIPKLHQDKESVSDQREVIEESTGK